MIPRSVTTALAIQLCLATAVSASETEILAGDFDGDGQAEIVELSADTIAPDSDFRQWRLYDSITPDPDQLVFAWNSISLDVVPSGDFDLIQADDAYWYLSGAGAKPIGGAVHERTGYDVAPTLADEDIIVAAGMDHVPRRQMRKLAIDLDLDGKMEKLIYAVGQVAQDDNGTNPYVLASSKGEEIMRGRTMSFPWIFRGENGLTVINQSFAGYDAALIPWEALP